METTLTEDFVYSVHLIGEKRTTASLMKPVFPTFSQAELASVNVIITF